MFYFSSFTGQATLIKEPTIEIQCLSGSMLVTIKNAPASYDGLFSGMVYPKGLAKNSTCLSEYRLVGRINCKWNKYLTDFYFISGIIKAQ